MHLEEKVDLWYLSEIFFTLRYMSIPSGRKKVGHTLTRLTIGMLVCPTSGSTKRRRIIWIQLFANLAGGKRREQTNLSFDFLESLSTILGQSINLDTTACDADSMYYTLTEIY